MRTLLYRCKLGRRRRDTGEPVPVFFSGATQCGAAHRRRCAGPICTCSRVQRCHCINMASSKRCSPGTSSLRRHRRSDVRRCCDNRTPSGMSSSVPRARWASWRQYLARSLRQRIQAVARALAALTDAAEHWPIRQAVRRPRAGPLRAARRPSFRCLWRPSSRPGPSRRALPARVRHKRDRRPCLTQGTRSSTVAGARSARQRSVLPPVV